MANLFDRYLQETLKLDQERLKKTRLPIVTVSGTFREDLKRLYDLPNDNQSRDVVFSRAHFSMAVAMAMTAWGNKIKPDTAWLVDPTNYVSLEKWRSILLTEQIGKTIARRRWLKLLKDLIDKFGRQKLPILESITPPLISLTDQVEQPIISLHIAAGNILAAHGKKIVQVITDPHVRPEYLQHAELPNLKFCVFDRPTQTEFLEMAEIAGKTMAPERVVVTGPPVDPRILQLRRHKAAWRSGQLKLLITTGGLGTNKPEIAEVLQALLPHLRREPLPYQLILYAGTQIDIAELGGRIAAEEQIKVGATSDAAANFRILYHPQIFDANELLLRYGFPWADGVISKPSGDMAYDAAAAGCFLLTLNPWGVWEERIRDVFEQREISREAETAHLSAQLSALSRPDDSGQSWIERAMNQALSLPENFTSGCKNIIEIASEFEANK